MSAPSEPLYLFGYGSLIWNPGFKPSREWCYELQGFHRSASVYSWKYRGTPESPGLVLGLEAGGTCAGILYEVAPENRESVYEEVLLRERGRRMPHEQTWMPIYDEHHFEFEIPDGTRGRALVFVCNPESPQYAGKLSQDEKAKLLAFSRGENGTSLEYFQNLLREFHRLGISDPEIENLVQMAQKLPEFK